MADTKITALTALTAADPANDVIPIVDVSDTTMAASGTTKKISVNNILGASGTATLASATITGGLTAARLIVTGGTIPTNGLWLATTNTLEFAANSLAQYRIAPLGVFSWFDGAGGTRMTLNSNGLGVGVSPSFNIHARGTTDGRIQVEGASGFGMVFIQGSSGNNAQLQLNSNGGSGRRFAIISNSSGQFTINDETAVDTRLTLDSTGNLLVGTTNNAPAGTQSHFVNEFSGGAKWGFTSNQTVSSATAYTHIAFATNGTVRGSIDANNVTLTYGVVSDYRLKENVQPISSGLSRVNALKPSSYKWKESEADGEGFIAHELASVVPLAVIGQKDAVNEDGSIKAQQIDLSKIVPILVAAIQELTARVQTLEAR